MVMSSWLKGRISIIDFDNMPFYQYHTLWKKYTDYFIQESKKTDEQRGGEALGRMMEDAM